MARKKTLLLEKYVDEIYPIGDHDICRDNEPNFVYVVHNIDSNLYKIGITKNLNDRIRAIECASGCEIKFIIGIQLEINCDEKAIVVEKYIHNYFKDLRKRGEWFNLSRFNLREIESLFYRGIDGCNIFNPKWDEFFSRN